MSFIKFELLNRIRKIRRNIQTEPVPTTPAEGALTEDQTWVNSWAQTAFHHIDGFDAQLAEMLCDSVTARKQGTGDE